MFIVTFHSFLWMHWKSWPIAVSNTVHLYYIGYITHTQTQLQFFPQGSGAIPWASPPNASTTPNGVPYFDRGSMFVPAASGNSFVPPHYREFYVVVTKQSLCRLNWVWVYPLLFYVKSRLVYVCTALSNKHCIQALRIESSHIMVVILLIFQKGGVFTLVGEVPGATDLSPLLSSTETCTLTESVVQTGLEGKESTRKYSNG